MQVVSQAAAVSGNPTPPRETITLDVGGMKCAGCVQVVEKQLTQYPGVVSACVNLVTAVAAVECAAGTVDRTALAAQLTKAGFPTQPRSPHQHRTQDDQQQREEIRQQIINLVIAGLLILLSGMGHFFGHASVLSNIWFHWGLATLALLLPGRTILIDGWRGLWQNAPNMNTLVGLGTLSAYMASCIALLFPQLGWECFFDEPVMLLGFILLGRTLEQQAKTQAAVSLKSLLALRPKMAHLIPSETDEIQKSVDIPAFDVKVGEYLRVLPGENIPSDGLVVAGETAVDESMLTGEPVPVGKKPGDAVAAGTMNQSGVIAMRATRTGQDTTVAQIIALVEEAQTRKAPVQQLADRVAGYFAYGVMAVAALTFGFWYFVGTQIWPHVLMPTMGHHQLIHQTPLLLSLKLAIAVLVVACPCALGLATPTAILVCTGMGAQRGILIKGGDVLELVHQLDVVVFDKTGTLTTGKPTVTDSLPIGTGHFDVSGELSVSPGSAIRTKGGTPNSHYPRDIDRQSLLQMAAAVETGSNHPLAQAITQAAIAQDLPIPRAQDFRTVPGLGVSAWVDGQLVLLGTREWLTKHEIDVKKEEEIAQGWAELGKTIVYVAVEGRIAGLIAVRDQPRPDAKTTIEELRQMGLKVKMLTGDRQKTANAIARSIGMASDEVIAEVRPEEKAEAIARWQAEGLRVAMVADGINDAPALAKADVGIALHSGSDVAQETAETILMRNCLWDVVESIRLGRATYSKIRQNLFWALAYNSLGIPVAAGLLLPGLGIGLTPAAAGAMMAFSSVSVVTNSLLLRRCLWGSA